MDNILFWAEFPDLIDWEKLNSLLLSNEFIMNVGIACRDYREYEKWQFQLENYSNICFEMGWPVLTKDAGYWFSSQTDKDLIDSLEQYRGKAIKLDIEPPIPINNGTIYLHFWFFKQLFRKGKNYELLKNKLYSLSRDAMVVQSTFPLPFFILRRMGMTFDKKFKYNFIYYTSFIPRGLKWLYNIYYSWFVKKVLKEYPDSYFACGLLTTGIFGNEPVYSSCDQLQADIQFLKKRGVKNLVIFRAGSLLELNDSEKWIKILKEC